MRHCPPSNFKREFPPPASGPLLLPDHARRRPCHIPAPRPPRTAAARRIERIVRRIDYDLRRQGLVIELRTLRDAVARAAAGQIPLTLTCPDALVPMDQPDAPPVPVIIDVAAYVRGDHE